MLPDQSCQGFPDLSVNTAKEVPSAVGSIIVPQHSNSKYTLFEDTNILQAVGLLSDLHRGPRIYK